MSAVLKRGPWRQVGKYIGRDVWLKNGRHTTEIQHRVVAAEKVGRPLLTGEHAHHENEVKTDNRPENLEVLTRAEHTKRHFGTGRTMIDLTCQGCGCSFERDVRRRSAKFCGRSCVGRAGGKASGEQRLTKPVSPRTETRLSVLLPRYPGLSRGELLRSGAIDDTRTRQPVRALDLAAVAP